MGKSKELAELGQVVSQSGGNVGIGRSDPQTNLHIQSTGDTGIQITKEGSVAGRVFTPSGGLAFGVDTANGTTERLRIDSSGNVGIGYNNPLSIFHVGSGLDANVPITLAPATGGNVEFRNTSSTGSFTFTNANGSSEKMRIDASGRVTMPYQPFGRANGSAAAVATFTGGQVFNFFQAQATQGGMTFSNGGRWTVPVGGIYLITASVYFYPQTGNHYGYYVTVNGIQTEAVNQWEWTGSSYSGRMDRSLVLSCLFEANANDYFELKTTQTCDLWSGPSNNHFGIYLLG
jgi:hypothetical protein